MMTITGRISVAPPGGSTKLLVRVTLAVHRMDKPKRFLLCSMNKSVYYTRHKIVTGHTP
jgi:hypothetical protein